MEEKQNTGNTVEDKVVTVEYFRMNGLGQKQILNYLPTDSVGTAERVVEAMLKENEEKGNRTEKLNDSLWEIRVSKTALTSEDSEFVHIRHIPKTTMKMLETALSRDSGRTDGYGFCR